MAGWGQANGVSCCGRCSMPSLIQGAEYNPPLRLSGSCLFSSNNKSNIFKRRLQTVSRLLASEALVPSSGPRLLPLTRTCCEVESICISQPMNFCDCSFSRLFESPWHIIWASFPSVFSWSANAAVWIKNAQDHEGPIVWVSVYREAASSGSRLLLQPLIKCNLNKRQPGVYRNTCYLHWG